MREEVALKINLPESRVQVSCLIPDQVARAIFAAWSHENRTRAVARCFRVMSRGLNQDVPLASSAWIPCEKYGWAVLVAIGKTLRYFKRSYSIHITSKIICKAESSFRSPLFFAICRRSIEYQRIPSPHSSLVQCLKLDTGMFAHSNHWEF